MQVNEIINKIDNTREIKRFKELEESIKNNKEYISLINEFNKQENPSNKEIIELRKKLFEIDGVKEYLELEKETMESDSKRTVIKNSPKTKRLK